MDASQNTDKPLMDIKDIVYSELKDGAKGVALGLADWFVDIRRERLLKLKLLDLTTNKPLTASITVDGVEDLRGARRTKVIRNCLKNRWKNWEEIVEKILMEIEKHKNQWENPKEDLEEVSKESKKIKSTLPPEELQKRTTELLQAPNFLYRIKGVYEKGVIADRYRCVLEEDDKKLLCFIILLSAKSYWPQCIWSTAHSGFGKSNIIVVTAWLMPRGYVKTRSHITGPAMRYGDQDFKVLFIREWRPSLEQDARLMSKEDGTYEYEISVKDPETHKWTTQTGELSARSIVTTSAERLPSLQMLRRVWLLSINEDPELTKKVNQRQAEYRAGKVQPTSPDEVAVIQTAVELLKPYDVVVPYAEHLVSMIKWDRSRFDYFLDIISIVAWIHQYQRKKDAQDKILATPADLYIAIKLCWPTLVESILNLPERLKKFWIFLPELLEEGITIKELAVKSRLGQSTVRGYLSELEEFGYALSSKKQGSRENEYCKSTSVSTSAELLKQHSTNIDWTKIASPDERTPENPSPEDMLKIEQAKQDSIVCDPLTGERIDLQSPPDSTHVSTEPNSEADLQKTADSSSSQLSNIDSALQQPVDWAELFGKPEEPNNGKADFVWERVRPEEKCELCGKAAVEYEIFQVAEKKKLRRCETCFQTMRKKYCASSWKSRDPSVVRE